MKIDIDVLHGPLLNWAVATCEGAGAAYVNTFTRGLGLFLSDSTQHCGVGELFQPSIDWAQAGPIIEREEIFLAKSALGGWTGSMCSADNRWTMVAGPTPLVAAMRAYVATKLGHEVSVPASLLKAITGHQSK